MIDPERLLGAMLRNGLSGVRRSGRKGAASFLAGNLTGAVGLGIIGVAIAAFDHFMEKKASGSHAGPQTPPAGPSAIPPPPPPPPGSIIAAPAASPTLEERKQAALLLVRAMIAAANADGTIDAEEKQGIIRRLETAGLSSEERAFLLQELDSPPSIDDLLAQVQDSDVKRQIYAASLMAVSVDTQAEKDYLHYLGLRLGIDDREAAEIHGRLGIDIP